MRQSRTSGSAGGPGKATSPVYPTVEARISTLRTAHWEGFKNPFKAPLHEVSFHENLGAVDVRLVDRS